MKITRGEEIEERREEEKRRKEEEERNEEGKENETSVFSPNFFRVAKISSLKKLKEIELCRSLSLLPKELSELSGLRKVELTQNEDLGNAPQDEAFPAELGKMKSLRVLNLTCCGLRTIPAFVGELESLEFLDLSGNDVQIYSTLDFLIESFPCLREVWLSRMRRTPESLAHLEAVKAKLLAKNPNAKPIY